VISTGIDERANQLSIGVADTQVGARVLEILGTLGVPGAAVKLVETPPTKLFNTSLTAHFRPLPGGVRIRWLWNAYGSDNDCTLGFSAYTYGQSDMKFLTNSHCTETRGVIDYKNYYNHLRVSTSDRVGIEVQDPPFVTGGSCPFGMQCRFSDAAVATYYGATGEFGKIARTTSRSTGTSGALTINSSIPRIPIISTFAYPYVGETLDKVGIRTGWTSGQVFESCADINAGGGIWLWCQDKVAAGAWHGDSGSPVFYFVNVNGEKASVVGLLWGGPGVSIDDKVFYMSSMNGIGSDGIYLSSVY
jgi:hypothetical protein